MPTLDEALCSIDFKNAVDDIITLKPYVYDLLEEEDKHTLLGTIVAIIKHDIADTLNYEDLDNIANCIKKRLLFGDSSSSSTSTRTRTSTRATQALMHCYITAVQKAYEPAIKEAYNDVYYRYSAQGLLEEAEYSNFLYNDRRQQQQQY
jgi:uncharacterized protein YfkK (UPF0435 family)